MARIRDLRRSKGLSQEELAARMGVSHSTVQRLESGGMKLTEHYVRSLATALEIHPGEIFEPLPTSPGRLDLKVRELLDRLPPDALDTWLRNGSDLLRLTTPQKRRRGRPIKEA